MGNELYRKTCREAQQIMDDAFKGTVFFAFSEKQFEEGMKKIGAKSPKELYSLNGTGGFYKKSDAPKIHKAFADMSKVKADALASGGEEYAFQMFSEELANHEFGYARDLDPTIEATGYEVEDICKSKVLWSGMVRALETYGLTLETIELNYGIRQAFD